MIWLICYKDSRVLIIISPVWCIYIGIKIFRSWTSFGRLVVRNFRGGGVDSPSLEFLSSGQSIPLQLPVMPTTLGHHLILPTSFSCSRPLVSLVISFSGIFSIKIFYDSVSKCLDLRRKLSWLRVNFRNHSILCSGLNPKIQDQLASPISTATVLLLISSPQFSPAA